MIVCEDAQLVVWRPDFSSSGQVIKPRWTKLIVDETVLGNALEWIDWRDDPVQVTLCEECGIGHCSSGGYVHVSRIGRDLLWTRPQLVNRDERDEWEHAVLPTLRQGGPILFPS